MPELPEVEVLVRHLVPSLAGRQIHDIEVFRPRTVRPHTPREVRTALKGATISNVRRRAKFLVFDLKPARPRGPEILLGHLGMTGRMFLQPADAPRPPHAAVLIRLGPEDWVFEDVRGFGRLTFDTSPLAGLGPEPFGSEFSAARLEAALRASRQPIKVKLLDQSVVAGVGNIYACEALHRARISPKLAASRLTMQQVRTLRNAIRAVLTRAIRFGAAASLDFAGTDARDRTFYYGSSAEVPRRPSERFRVYDRAGQPCPRCGTSIRRIVQAGRSTYFCPLCQK